MEDHRIVDLFWQRSGDAITQVRKKYGNYCYAIALRLLSDRLDAEECVNDTWLGAWNAMPVHRPERLAPFLGKITRSLAFNRYQARQAEKRGAASCPWPWRSWETASPPPPAPPRRRRTGSWSGRWTAFSTACRPGTATSSSAGTGTWSRWRTSGNGTG